ncbi:MAG: SDR family oxidoreductase [Pseudonocardiaceae bacterium]|nr:SDR family oxidoreductase [Pseudonocardiaceae bacterium]
MKDFEGLVAVVTGGASGIGASTGRILRGRGAHVFTLDRDAHEGSEGVVPIVADVTDQDSVTSAVEEVARSAGGVDVLVNNAGIGAAGTIEDNPFAEWNHVIDVNVLGVARASRAALPHLRRSTSAVIVNTCSAAADVGLPQRALYSASKGAVLSLTRAMAADYVRDGIRVCCVNPGTTDTPWVQRLLDRAPDPVAERIALEARQPSGRLISADEVAQAIAYLASPLAGATTGVALRVDGGLKGLRLPP